MMHIIAILFDSRSEAAAVRRGISSAARALPSDASDAAIVYRDRKDRLRVHRTGGRRTVGSILGGVLGAALGWTLPFPPESVALAVILAGMIGAGLGLLGAAVVDNEAEREILDDVGIGIRRGKTMLILLAHESSIPEVLDGLKGHSGRVLKTSLSPEWEERIQAVSKKPQRGSEKTDAP